VIRKRKWATLSDVQNAFTKAKVLNWERLKFEISGGNYRLIAAFNFGSQIVYLKFLGTHAECDKVEALTVSKF
jgi:mRNA interferase HigB